MTVGTAPNGGSVIVLGAGVAGLAACDHLIRAGYAVTLIEQTDRCGGTHRSFEIGPYTFDAGSIFYEDTARIFALAPGIREACPEVMRVQRRIAPDGTLLHYPLEPREFLKGPRAHLLVGGLGMLWSRLAVRRDGSLDAITRKRLGRPFFESTGLGAYMARFHHVPPAQIDETFFFHRMAFIERSTRLAHLASAAWTALTTQEAVNHKTRRPLRVRPRAGFDRLFRPLVSRLRGAGVDICMEERLESISRQGSLFRVRTDKATHITETVVSTVPIEDTHRALFEQPSGLLSLDMTTLFVSAAHVAREAGNVLFNFHGQGRWKRATVYSRIYPEPVTSREFLAVECTIPPGEQADPEAAFADLRTHLEGLGIATDLRLEGHTLVDSAYPLYQPGSTAQIAQVHRRIADAGIIMAGRQGRFEYLPTSSGVIRRVVEELQAAGLDVSEGRAAA